ncbi:Thermostable carboxypeptidase 1 [Anatilimnocola aggregata]|uniref:Metal-dependent carboxypeptidase n=1 Tax=Anatilimnocola aggregata TaxID=2528021 RepID=A0A517YJF6_9BACT|nr:carboxypeptidase M32 [Anatilimnocola aggregata]QDU30360.1 Thermostable carboxypeptidase 1 [Anatilimnocola aggregata]
MNTAYEQLCGLAKEAALVESVEALLGWDERTYLPEAAGDYRAEQMTFLSGLAHQKRTQPKWGELLDELAGSDLAKDLHSDTGTTIRQLKRDYDKRVKLPQLLVEELTRASVLGQQAWVKARAANDFAMFQPHLTKIIELKRQQAEAVGYEDQPYDALLDDYEPQARTKDLTSVLGKLRQELVPLVHAIMESGKVAPVEIVSRLHPRGAQEAFGKTAAAAIGFEFQRGRLDVTHHPFCTELGPNDCRITTRYDEHHFNGAFFGILHEAGHGIYDQGLRSELFGLPPGQFVSLGIHESQSRMWENLVGRSNAFWQYFFPKWQEFFPVAAEGVTQQQLFAAINHVQPSLIRVEADEATYNLHIIVRFELEQALLSGDLPVNDLPAAWMEKYREYLGIAPPNDANGCLQDVHWSAALFGYFPTYSLGNLYASQLFEQADKDLGGLNDLMKRGEFLQLKLWLNEKIHRHGQCYSASELVQRITGKPLGSEPLMRHLRGKLLPLYGLA